MLIGAATAFTVLSVVCAVAPNGPVLVAARLLQGIAAGCGLAVGRAVVTDTYRGERAAAKFGAISSVTFLGPVLAPALGGLILAHGTWRTVFAVLTVFGLGMLVAVVAGIPETLRPDLRQPAGLRGMGARIGDLLRDWSFMRHIALQCLATAGFFTYIGGSSFVLQSVYHVSPSRYSVIFATNAAAMALSALVFRSIVGRFGAARLRVVGVCASTAAAVGLLGAALATAPLAVVWPLLCVVVGGMGLTFPATTALAQEAGRRSAGSASALQGGLSFLVGGLITPLTGIVGYDSLLPMALAMTVFFLAAIVLLGVLSTRARRPVGAVAAR
jgi:DHA1 family bicyclomycin/chloramphenicol resistance-like MFS transporter